MIIPDVGTIITVYVLDSRLHGNDIIGSIFLNIIPLDTGVSDGQEVEYLGTRS